MGGGVGLSSCAEGEGGGRGRRERGEYGFSSLLKQKKNYASDYTTSIRFTMGGDSPYEILPAAIVSTYHAFLLQVAACALDVRHRFLWEGVHWCPSCLSLPPAEFTPRTCT